MPWDGSGTYSPPVATFPEVNGTVIDAGRYNPTIQDLAAGITACITKDGQNAPTANLPMAGFKHTGAGVAAVAGEYVTYNQSGVQFPLMGIGTSSSAWDATYSAIDLAAVTSVFGSSSAAYLGFNTYSDGGLKAKTTDVGAKLVLDASGLYYDFATSVSAGSAQTFTNKFAVYGDGRVFGTALHNNAGSVAGTTNQYIASGTATLNVTSIAGITGISATCQCVYTRVGNVVTVAGSLNVQSSSSVANAVAFAVSLPIASDFTQTYDGSGNCSNPVGDYVVYADAANNRMAFGGTQTSGASWLTSFVFQYEIK